MVKLLIDCTTLAGSGKVGPVNQLNSNSLAASTDCHISVRNHFVISNALNIWLYVDQNSSNLAELQKKTPCAKYISMKRSNNSDQQSVALRVYYPVFQSYNICIALQIDNCRYKGLFKMIYDRNIRQCTVEVFEVFIDTGIK